MAELQKAPWSDWETVRLIGRGSFGTVYEIQRKLVDDDTESAALKVITIPQNPGDVEEMYNEGYDDESITATFNSHLKSIVAEYSLMRKMDGSANIVNCKDIRYIQHDDGIGWDIYIRMELLTPLMKALPIDADEATVIRIGKDICNALVLCKKHEIVHRDIKPQNIFVSANGDYKLGDFGIAKTVEKTMGGTKIGTYKYMAPEVYNNQPYGSAADIYSLGLVLYWLLNERRMPFMPLPPARLMAGQDEEARQRRLSGERLPEPAHGSTGLKQIVLKACAYDPKDRYTSAAAMMDDLNKLTGGAAVIPPVVVPGEKPDEIQEDDLTTGPVFGDSHQKKTDVSESDTSEVTVGPIFRKGENPKDDVQEDGDSSTLSDEKNAANRNRKKLFFRIASIVLGVVAIILVFLLLRSCGETTFDPTSNYTEPVVLVNGLSVKIKPNKTSYYVGETLDTSGLTLTASYNDGTNKTITSGYSCSPTAFRKAGTQTITVTYGGKTATFTVNVAAVSVSSISVKSKPSKISYYIGETLNTSGLALTASYNDGTNKTITSGYSCSPTAFSAAGTQTITVMYGEEQTSFTVQVVDPYKNLSGTGSAGYPGETRVSYQYYNGCHFYVDDNVLYVIDDSTKERREIFRTATDLCELCIVDGYVFFSEQAEDGTYRIASINTKGEDYRIVLENGYGCFYLDGWIYTNAVRHVAKSEYAVVRVRPGKPETKQTVGNGKIVACDVDNKFLWISNSNQLERINLKTMKTECCISELSDSWHGYVKDGILYVKRGGLYLVEGDTVSYRPLSGLSNFAIVGNKLIYPQEDRFTIIDLTYAPDVLNLDDEIFVGCTVSIRTNPWYFSLIPAHGNCIAYVCEQGGLYLLDLDNNQVRTLISCSCTNE